MRDPVTDPRRGDRIRLPSGVQGTITKRTPCCVWVRYVVGLGDSYVQRYGVPRSWSTEIAPLGEVIRGRK